MTSVYMMMGGLAVLTFFSAIYLFKRYYAVFRIPQNDLRWGERAVANK